jgi:hypothetical protein
MRLDDFVSCGGSGSGGAATSGSGAGVSGSDASHHVTPPGSAGVDGWPREVLRDDVTPGRK